MPAALPIIGAFASGSMGAVVAGTATFTQFVSAAGAVMTGIGALRGDKDMMKIGAAFSLGSGLASALSAAGGAAAATNGAATGSAMDAAQTGATGAADATNAAAAAAPVAAVPDPTAGTAQSIMQASAPGAAPTTLAGAAAVSPITKAPVLDMAGSKLEQAAKGITSEDLASWWDKTKKAAGGAATWMEKNPALMKIGGDMLAGMYGPQAEKFDFEKSIYERTRRNLNTPIALRYTPGGKR